MFRKGKDGAQFRSGGIEMREENLSDLEQLLYERHHLSLGSYQPNYVKRRISARIRSLRLDSLSGYLEFLEKHPGEAEELIQALSISVTSFFRDEDTFRALSREAAPELLRYAEENQTGVRVWSAGCCTGEEAYSLAMVFLEADSRVVEKMGLRIWATDLDDSAIQISRRGIYAKDRLENLPPALIRKYFRKHPEGYQVRSPVKDLVSFRRENLLSRGFSGFEGLDLIMCRNLLIYLKRQEQIRLLANFDRGLREGGYLVLGKTEFLLEPYRSRYEHISVSERLYKKPLGAVALEQAGGGG